MEPEPIVIDLNNRVNDGVDSVLEKAAEPTPEQYLAHLKAIAMPGDPYYEEEETNAIA